MPHLSNWPTHCQRCGADLSKVSSIVSKFNTDTICMDCKVRERAHPNYKAADAAEVASVRAGNMNFEGVGCPPVLLEPICMAEQLAVTLAGQDRWPVMQIALCHGGELVPEATPGADKFVFPDGSVLEVMLTNPVSCTVVSYS